MGYRSSTWSLGDALAADDALRVLAQRPMRPENAAAIAVTRSVIEPNARRKTGDELVSAGFRHVGVRTESAGYVSASVDVFVDRDSTTYVTVRRGRSLLGLSKYYILTHFDDGTCIETVARSKPVYTSGGELTVRAGHDDDVVRDVEAHLEAVRARVAKGARILPVRDSSGVQEISRFHISHVIQPDVATSIAETRTTERKLATGLILPVATLVLVMIRLILNHR